MVFTFKEGLLSPMAHDLCIHVTSWKLEVEEGSSSSLPAQSLRATVDAGSLRVDSAVRDGRPLPNALSEADIRKIEANIRQEVLHSERFPTIVLTGSELRAVQGGFEMAAELSLHGVTRPMTVQVARRGVRLVAELTIHQADFGIKPYRAMLGTLRIRPDVRVYVSVPVET